MTHLERVPIDVSLAARQWTAYCDTLRATGWDLIEVPGVDDCPDAVFVEDTVVMYRNVAVISRPGARAAGPRPRRSSSSSRAWAAPSTTSWLPAPSTEGTS